MERRNFIKNTSLAASGILLSQTSLSALGISANKKKKIALVGTGIRGIQTWGEAIQKNYSDVIEFVGLCDLNKGRMEFAKERMGINCPTFTDFEQMMKTTKPEVVIVCTIDATHDKFIIRA